MPAQRSRSDVQPISWELPVAGAAVWLALLLLLIPAGRGAATWLVGRGFCWPQGSQALLHSVGGLLTGDTGAGLSGAQASSVAPAPLIVLTVSVGELLLIAASVAAAVAWWRHLGPAALQGMADRPEIEKVLGLSNLRRKRAVIRPDLHAPARRSPTARRTS